MTKYELLGIGNALVDVMSDVNDGFLQAQDLVKGSMQLIDENRANNLVGNIGKPHMISGGSCANSMAGFASLGGKGAFIGKIKNDELGRSFQNDMEMLGCSFAAVPSEEGLPTGMCLVFVTPDAQRTMCTHLGTAAMLSPTDLNETVISNSKIIYLEGYLFDQPIAQKAMFRAAKTARKAGVKVAITLSDSFCVDRHRDSFIDLVQGNADILFANEDEFLSLYQAKDLDEAAYLNDDKCAIMCITRGEKGAVVFAGDDRVYVEAEVPENIIDTTGAGDQFAAGFLFGLSKGEDLAKCAQIGAIAAAEVISHFGARPEKCLSDLVNSKLG